ncbi:MULTISPECIES: DUF4231 domain-containing protein [unclassified Saccharopolyspora]|uniref:DUF4231 domain-containing protein n=1 Tax=unclassified Saccharopolyspora TaxID=2646250 RepID=UPI001CD47673|nr:MULTISPECIES: DUF4231 domain-containing protein [unclassified Saccharopolyspora]MCA1186609.1 DUF4231 domain-containing protein [Saccharopolyspora sp. 6T]MCA1193209.1 DUF4231 domain-containing protein [Saccharopolyspora sp. 6V]MCA1227999.1 DUF4231 domain-containing protein [Saccharopolyspora sp. 6M]MCA1281947.1 DUF4231 domain-containing protein [Saccharopolyspora sp. 7B]
MERWDAGTGIIGGGVIAGETQPQDWERRISELSEQLYRARILQRLLLIWTCPGNVALAGLSISGIVLLAPPVAVSVLAVAIPVGSVAASGRIAYRHHFAVRAVASELRELERAHREHQLDEWNAGDLLGMRKRYRADLPDVIERYRAEAGRHRWKDHVLHTVVIAGSIISATVTAASAAVVGARWAAVAISLLVAVAAAFGGYAKYRERAASLQQTADVLEREYHSVELRAGRYSRFDDEGDAYAEFADTVESLREEQAKRQQHLNQSIDVTSVAGQ